MTHYASISQKQTSEPFELQLARGQILGHRHVHKFGYNDAVGNSTETIWFQGAAYTWPTAAALLEITSTHNTEDVTAGDGAQTVILEGLDANYAEISEEVTLTGQTAATTAKSYLRLHRMYVNRTGTNATNTGVIYAANASGSHSTGTPTDVSLIYSTIGATEGQTLQCFYTVPAGYTAYLVSVSGGSSDGTNATTLTLKARTLGSGFRSKDKFIVFKSHQSHPYPVPTKFLEKTDLELQGIAAASTTDVAADFDLILVSN